MESSYRTHPIDGAKMVAVPAGTFLMGRTEGDIFARDHEKPQRTVFRMTRAVVGRSCCTCNHCRLVKGYDVGASPMLNSSVAPSSTELVQQLTRIR